MHRRNSAPLAIWEARRAGLNVWAILLMVRREALFAECSEPAFYFAANRNLPARDKANLEDAAFPRPRPISRRPNPLFRISSIGRL